MSSHPRQLKKLRRFSVPASSFEAGRQRLLASMAEAPFMPHAVSSRSGLFAWKPVMLAVAVGALALSSGGVALASKGSLPGDRLYPVKLATEEIQERLAISPAHKFAVQAAHAARRLDETERLMARNGLAQADRVGRVQAALRAYEAQLFSMNAIALRMSVDRPGAKAGNRAIQAAERVLDRHAALIASATAAQPLMADAVLEPVDAAFELQDDVLNVLPAPEGMESDGILERRHQERTEKIQERLKALQYGLDRLKPLEILPVP